MEPERLVDLGHDRGRKRPDPRADAAVARHGCEGRGRIDRVPQPETQRIPRSANACVTALAAFLPYSDCAAATVRFARSVIVVPGKSNEPCRMTVSAVVGPTAARMSQSARDQIWPSWCTSPFRSPG